MGLRFCISSKFLHDSMLLAHEATLSCVVRDVVGHVLKEGQYERDCIGVVTFLIS